MYMKCIFYKIDTTVLHLATEIRLIIESPLLQYSHCDGQQDICCTTLISPEVGQYSPWLRIYTDQSKGHSYI